MRSRRHLPSPPYVHASDLTFDEAWWFSGFLSELWADEPPTLGKLRADEPPVERTDRPPPPLDYISHHMYPLGGSDGVESVQAKLLDPRKLDASIVDRLRLSSRLVTNRTAGRARVCVSETGGSYNSGQQGVTDAFGSSIWWLNHLAT